MLKKFLSFALCLIMLISVFVPNLFVFADDLAVQNSNTDDELSLDEMPIVDHGSYQGNQGDSTVYNLNGKGLSTYDKGERFNGNGNVGIDGTSYTDGFEVWIARWNFRNETSWAYATFDIGGRYKTLTGKTNLINSYNTTKFDTTVYFYDGDTLLASYRLTPTDYIKEISVNVEGVKELKLLVKDNVAVSGGTSFAIYDLFFDNCEWEPFKKNKYDSVAQYMADVITDRGYEGVWKSEGVTPHNNVYNNMLNPDIMSAYLRDIKREQDNNKVFQTAVGAWKEAELIFEPGSSMIKGPINSVDYYTSIILAVLDCAINDSFIPDAANNIKSTTSLITTAILEKLQLDKNKTLSELESKEWSLFSAKEQHDAIQALYGECENLKRKSINADSIFEIYEYSTGLVDFVNKVSALEEVAKLSESVLPVLDALDDSCSAVTHPEMKAALVEVKKVCNDNFEKYLTIAIDGAVEGAAIVSSDVIDGMWQGVLAASGCGFGTGAAIGYAVGKAISNFCFSTDATKEQYYALCAMAEFQDIMISATKNLGNEFAYNKTTENAVVFLAAIRMLEDTWLLSTDYAQQYQKIVWTEGFVNKVSSVLGFGNKETYEEISNACEDIKEDARTMGRVLLDAEFSFVKGLIKDDYGLYTRYQYDRNINTSWKGKTVKVACPTDVDVYFGDECVLSIVSDEIVDWRPGICVYVKNSEKYILLPDDGDFSVKIKGTDSGTMDYIVTEYTGSGEKKVTSFDDVPLTEGCTYDTAVDSVNEDGYILTDENGQTVEPDFVSGELAFSSASLTLHNDLCVNYKANTSVFDELGYTDPYVKIVFNDEETVIKSYYVSDGKYVFDFSGITPDKMNDTIYATLYAKYNGVLYASETKEYSVAQYCYNMLGKYNTDEYAEFRTLLVDLLNYGAASQVYTGYNADSLVNSSLTDEQASFATADAPELKTVMDKAYATVEEPTVIWKGAGLNLKDSVAMRFKIECDNIEDISIRVTDDSGALWVIHNTLFEETDGGYYVYFEGFNAGQMKDSVYLTAYNGNTPVSDTVRYSIESYAYSKQNSTDEDLNKLLEAMMKYGNSAYSYIN